MAIVPAAFAFLALGQQIAMVLFMYGSVQAESAHIIGFMLTAFGLGLIPFSAQFLMLRGFYAFEDTRTPFTINIWIAAANVVMSSSVYYGLRQTKYERWSVVAMCAVYGVSYCIGLAITAAKLKRRLRGLEGGRIMQTYTRLMASAAVAAGSAYVIAAYVTHVFGSSSRIGAYLGLYRRRRHPGHHVPAVRAADEGRGGRAARRVAPQEIRAVNSTTAGGTRRSAQLRVGQRAARAVGTEYDEAG